MLSQKLDTETGRELLRLRGRNILLTEERDALRQERDALRPERDALQRERDALRPECDALRRERDALRPERDALRQERNALRQERDALWQERDALRRERDALLSSISWRVTEPLRQARRVVKKLFRRGIVEQPAEKDTEPLSENLVQTDVSASEGTVAEACSVSETSGGMDGMPLPDDTPDEVSATKTAEPHFHPSGLALEALCWKAGCSPANLLEGEGPRVSIWVAQCGNYFFHDIARLLYSGFQEMGVEATLNIVDTENECLNPVNLDIPLRIVVAPHEFFLFIPEAAAWPLKGERLWFVNTEQAGLDWFAKGAKHFGRADLILDFDQDNVRHLLEAGFPAQYLPLGFSDFCSDFDGTAAIPLSIATEGLPKTTREWQVNEEPLSEPLSSRPLDCCFFGAATPRRSEFFARNAALFADLDSYLRLQDMSCPLVSGETTPLDTASASSIVRRSKISLNLHQSDKLYFEWHRIVLLGMWQGAVVVSEPCSASWPLQPGRDYIVAGLTEMPAVIEYLLRSSAGMEKAEEIRRNALKTLRKHSMGVILKRIIGEYALSRGESRHA